MTDDSALRRELIRLLDGLDARMPFDEAIADFPDEAMNLRAPNVEYTPWHIIEHIRLTQADILEYVLGEGYVEKTWPDEYWPRRDAVATRDQWEASIQGFRSDVEALKAIVRDPARTSSRSCPTRRATRSCARCGSSATTTRITSASSRSFARSWVRGGPVTASAWPWKGPAMSDKIAMLERAPLFAGVDRDVLARIAELTEVEEVAAGTTLTHEGRHEGYFYILVAGTVEVSRGGEVIDTARSRSFFGEIALLDEGSRTATVTTLTPSLLLKVNNRGFEEMLEADASVREALEAEMARRLERMDTQSGS